MVLGGDAFRDVKIINLRDRGHGKSCGAAWGPG
jgi:hypothetical protein